MDCDCRPYLHMYTGSNELEEVGIISLSGMNIECDSNKEVLLGVSQSALCRALSFDASPRRNNFVSRCSPQQTHMYLPHRR